MQVANSNRTHWCGPERNGSASAITVPLSSPDVGDEERAAVLEVLSGSALSLGPKLREFEAALAEYTGSRYAVAVNSGTSALHLCMKAAEIQEGDEVITTPFSFVASANCILFEGGRPVFVDILPDTYEIDVAQIESAITPRTRAILPVHVFGRPCEMAKILEIAERHELCVIEDACEAIGARIGGAAVGAFGRAGVFAFYPNKQMTTGEGGAIVTDDAEIAALCRSWANQGRGESAAWLQHERLGYNYRISDINCAIGLAQLRRLPAILAARAQVASLYSEMLQDCPQIILPPPARPGTEISWFVYVVRLRDEFNQRQRDYVLQELRRQGIACSNYFAPIHLQRFYQKSFGYGEGSFPVTEKVAQRTIALPFFNRLPESSIEHICTTLHGILESLKIGIAAGVPA
jgi:perosamine synthetase